jgi:hypothetical protein
MWVDALSGLMPTLTALLVELAASLVELVVVFVTQVALRDPLAFVSFVVGAVITTASVAFVGYLAAGAAVDAIGIDLDSPGRTPPPRD